MTTQPTGTTRKRIRNPEKTRQRIIDFAIDEFTQRGFDGARIDAIADQAKANKSLIYKYFSSKDELYIASLKDTYERLRASQHELDIDDPDPIQSMTRLIESTFDTFAKDPRIVRMMTHENVQNARFLRQISSIRSLYDPLMDKLRQVIAKGQAIGLFRQKIDLTSLYISISALGYFYFSNISTLSIVLNKELDKRSSIAHQRAQAVEMVLAYLRDGNKESNSKTR